VHVFQVSSHIHMQLSETHKHGSVTLSDLGVATSSFYDLDNTTSWVSPPAHCLVGRVLPTLVWTGRADHYY